MIGRYVVDICRYLSIIGNVDGIICLNTTNIKDFFWELVMLIYGNLTYLDNREISSDEILKMTSRFLTGLRF